jgi:hypothetical protein
VLDVEVGVVQRLPQELLHILGIDPGCAQAGRDLVGCEVARDHLAQRVQVGLEARAAASAVASLRRTLPDGYSAAGTSRSPRLVEHQHAV